MCRREEPGMLAANALADAGAFWLTGADEQTGYTA
jgi:hypothetical protein